MSIQHFNYNETINQAEDLLDIASDIGKLGSNSFENLLSDIKKSWQGNASNEFHDKCEAIKNDIVILSRNLSALASEIQLEARILKAADDAAKEKMKNNSK